MYWRAIEILTAPVLIAQFGVAMVSVLWAFLTIQVPSSAFLDVLLVGLRQ